MGAVWSAFVDDKQLFVKSAYLTYSEDASNGRSGGGYSSRFAFYQTLKQAVARMELAKVLRSPTVAGRISDDTDLEAEDRAHVNFMLAHWPREMDVAYDDRHSEFPFAISIEHELEASAFAPGATTELNTNVSGTVASKEEAILKGLSENKLSSSEAIHQAMAQLKHKCNSSSNDADLFLRVLSKYSRATRLFVSQELHARSNVESAFKLFLLQQDYARAAHTVGKIAYGEEASRVKKKLKRLQEMSKLLQQSLDQKTAANSKASASMTHGSRAKDSFSQVMTDEMIALLQCQSSLQATLGIEYLVGSSLIETLHKLFALYPTHPTVFSLAVDLAEQFDVHPRQFSWALLKVLAQTEQWQTLLVFTAAARPAIGYMPVIELFLDEDHADLAHDLLALIDAPHEREEIMALLAKYHAQGTSGGGNTSAGKDDDAHSTYTFYDSVIGTPHPEQ